jgi:hypothetical protein
MSANSDLTSKICTPEGRFHSHFGDFPLMRGRVCPLADALVLLRYVTHIYIYKGLSRSIYEAKDFRTTGFLDFVHRPVF